MDEAQVTPVIHMDETATTMAARKQTGDEPKVATTTKAPSKYIREFEFLFVPIRIEMLRNRAQSGQLRHCQFRSLCWRYFLRCLPSNYDDWLSTCELRRREYDALKKRHLGSIKPVKVTTDEHNSETKSNHIDDAIAGTSEVSSSAVPNIENNKHLEGANDDDDDRDYVKLSNQCDYKNVLRTIERDVVRTFPDMEFFRQTEMQEILSNILFNFATENPHLSYKQGMHELLATLLYVAHTDSQNCLINYEGDYANETIAALLNIRYLEHDVYFLFSNLMASIETWYQNDEIIVVPDTASNEQLKDKSQHYINRSSSSSSRTSGSSSRATKLTTSKPQHGSVLGSKLMKISENIVKSYDSELFYHLEALQIAPQIYGIRWMRLLFGREFEFLDLLTIWDAIICDQDSMSLVDYVFASMLIAIRDELVNGDYTHCLNNLMRYQFKDVSHIINLALYIRDPINHSRPKAPKQTLSSRYGGASRSQHPHSQRAPHHQLSASSLTSKLSQQYISDKLLQPLASVGPGNKNQTLLNPAYTRRFTPTMTNQIPSSSSNRQHQADKQRLESLNRSEALSNVVQDGLGYLAQQASRNLSNANNSAKNKFLPNINKFVTSIGQNIQDKTNFPPPAQRNTPIRHPPDTYTPGPTAAHNRNMQAKTTPNQREPSKISSNSSHQNAHQQYHRISPNDMILSADPSVIKEYEMREMQSTSTTSPKMPTLVSDQKDRFPIGKISSINPGAGFDVSTESYDDLHSIVDYCWRLLSEQIDSLQRCLPKEKSLHSEDEIFVALAQLKKVRDVLKGSLKLEDELESAGPSAAAATPGSKS